MTLFQGAGARVAALTLALAMAGAAQAAAPFGANLRLATNVVRAPSYTPPKATAYVTSVQTPIFTTTSFNQPATDARLKLGDPLQVIAETDEGRWVLVGRGGVGAGYVARAMICPASVCRPGSGTASPPPL